MGFFVGNGLHRKSAGDLARIRREHPVYIGPYLYFIGLQGRPEQRSRVVRAAPTQGSGFIVHGSGDETGDHLQQGMIPEIILNGGVGFLLKYGCIAKSGVGADHLTGIQKFTVEPGADQGPGNKSGRTGARRNSG